jgi:hypothetical protein
LTPKTLAFLKITLIKVLKSARVSEELIKEFVESIKRKEKEILNFLLIDEIGGIKKLEKIS